MSSAWTANKALRLTLPIPQLATEVCDNQMLAASALNVDQSTQPDVLFQHQTQQKIDNIMIVKEAGGSRKRKADNPTRAYLRPSSMSRSNDRLQQCPNGEAERSPGLVPKLQDAQVGMNHKQLERQRRKADRAVEKAASGEFEAFDYANAPSVLYAKKDGNSGTAVVNPYSEATDAPKGMRKTKKESAGKSLTFRD
ncbi:exosome nuclease subunit [Puttea exsequens]|nr:exosome nuclease subunit [Puttea exsequens]